MSETIKVTLTADPRELEAALKRAQTAVGNFQKSTSAAGDAIRKMGAGGTSLGPLSGELQMASGRLSSLSDEAFKAHLAMQRMQSATAAVQGIGAAFAGAAVPVVAFAGATKAALANLEAYAGFDSMVRGLRTLDGTAEATSARLEALRIVAMAPGLSFEEAVRGDIRLRSVGLSAELSEKAMKALGNALATVGGSSADMSGVILALGQIQAKGKVSAEEINQLAERLPQIREAMKNAFGTSDTQALGKQGIGSEEFIRGIITELEKLPKVTGGAQMVLDNYRDSWASLKVQAAEFGVSMSSSWIQDVTRAMNQARRDLEALGGFFGVERPGLSGQAGETEEARAARKTAEANIKAAQEQSAAERALAEANADFWGRKAEERLAYEKDIAEQRQKAEIEALKRVWAAQEKVYDLRLSAEENLQRKINALKAQGLSGADAVNKAEDPKVKAEVAERTAEILALEKQLAVVRATSAKIAADQRVTDAQKALEIANDIQQRTREALAPIEENAKFQQQTITGGSLRAQEAARDRELKRRAEEIAGELKIDPKLIQKELERQEDLQELFDKNTGTVKERRQGRTADRAAARAAARDDKRREAALKRENENRKRQGLDPIDQPIDGVRDAQKQADQKAEDARKALEENAKNQLKAQESMEKLLKKIEPKLPLHALAP